MLASMPSPSDPTRHAEFLDPRLVEVYDAECQWSRDDDAFVAIAGRRPGSRVLDLGCGTGRLALGLADAGHHVTGIDPAPASLAAARAKAGASRITWMDGTCADAADGAFDVALMTSHVAQCFVDDDAWAGVLADLARAVVPGGVLAFDSRDPEARAWEQWNPVDSRRRILLSDGRIIRIWTEVTDADGGSVEFVHHYEFPGGDEILSVARLRFRDEEELRGSLAAAGFVVESVSGGWSGEPVGAGEGELLVVARRAGS